MRAGILSILPILVLGCNAEVDLGASSANNFTVVTTTTSTTTTTIDKSIFNQWDEDSAPGKRLPFTGRTYNSMFRDTIFLIDTGTQCICDMSIVPNPSGTITFSSCSGTGCSGIASTYTWTNVNGSLTLCYYSNPTVCTSYH